MFGFVVLFVVLLTLSCVCIVLLLFCVGVCFVFGSWFGLSFGLCWFGRVVGCVLLVCVCVVCLGLVRCCVWCVCCVVFGVVFVVLFCVCL